MKQPTFSADDLYFIESQMDTCAAHVTEQFHRQAHTFMTMQALNVMSEDEKLKIGKQFIKNMEEYQRTLDRLRSIRDQLEEARK